MKKIFAAFLCLALLASLLAGCGADSTSNDAPAAQDGSTVRDAGVETAPDADDELTGQSTVSSIVFDGGSAAIDGPGVTLEDDGEVVIVTEGTYRVSGSADAARLKVEAADNQDVTIILAGCDLTNPEDEVLYIKTASSAQIILAEGTENILVSGTAPASEDELPDADDDASGAALRAKCPLTITGSGFLAVYGYINNGIASSGDITVESGEIAVTAVKDGLKSKQHIELLGGSLTIRTAMDGIQADGSLDIRDGVVDIYTGSGALDAAMKTSDSAMMGGGPGGGSREQPDRASGEADAASDEVAETEETPEETETVETTSEEPEEAPAENADGSAEPAAEAQSASGEASGETRGRRAPRFGFPAPGMGWDADDEDAPSRKGLKSDGDITITGGTITLDTEDDAIHSDGAVVIEGGDISVSAGDDGVHGDTSLLIAGGSLDVAYCYEGLEANQIEITGGFVSVVAVDDGMNVNGGSGFGGPGGPSGEASGDTETETPILRISGGLVLVDSGGDGLDSNGSIYIEGGEIYVSGPSTNWDAAIDYGEGSTEFVITGGTLMAAGYSGMAEAPDSADDAQGSIYYVSSEYAPDGASVTLTDSSGNILVSHSFSHSFNCVVISSPDIAQGETYTLYFGDTEIEIEMTDASYSNRVSRGGPGGFGGNRSASREASSEQSDTEE